MLVALEQRGKPRRANLSLLSPQPLCFASHFSLSYRAIAKSRARVQENPRSLQSESLSNNFILEGHRKLNAHELWNYSVPVLESDASGWFPLVIWPRSGSLIGSHPP
jgi:hypothetical protein